MNVFITSTLGELNVSQLCEVYFLVGSLVPLLRGHAGVSNYHVWIQRWPKKASWGHGLRMKYSPILSICCQVGRGLGALLRVMCFVNRI